MLGVRLRELRQASGKSQAEVALAFGVSRSTIAQMELGNRRLHAQELGRLAGIYGCSPISLLATAEKHEDREEDELLHDLSQAVPEFSTDPTAFKGLREAILLSRELTMLEKTLGLEGYAAGPPSHGFGSPSTQWEGAHQGYVAAQEERWRMNLGDAPIRDVDDTLAMMRVRATQASLPEGISSLYLQAPETGTLVVVNESLSMEERRFQYVHGYAHALFDHGHRWLVCRADARSSLPELRATAFAGRFLLPETGVRRYLHSLGKDTLGRASGAVQKLYSERVARSAEESSVRVDGRGRKGATSISACDLTQIACYFGVSPALTSHNLRNLRYMSDEVLAALKSQDAEGTVARTKKVLHLRSFRKAPKRDAFRSRLLALTVEALRRNVIDESQFRHSAELLGATADEQQVLLDGIPS
jgi:transcriptional regulator with XRE-family HTH domain